jgi:hypothetical protein
MSTQPDEFEQLKTHNRRAVELVNELEIIGPDGLAAKNALKASLTVQAGLLARVSARYVREDRKLVHIDGYGWAIHGPGKHIRAATMEEINRDGRFGHMSDETLEDFLKIVGGDQ